MIQINAMPKIQSVHWPAIIKLHADDELIYIVDAEQFANDDALRHMHVNDLDMLIDSNGAIYQIHSGQTLQFMPAGATLNLDKVEQLLRLHLSNHGTCCVSKFHANSIREALMSVFA